MKTIKIVLAGLMLLLGAIYIVWAFSIGILGADGLSWLGTGIAALSSGFLSILAAKNCTRSWAGYLSFGSNTTLFILFLVSRHILQGPQSYIGIYLSLSAAILFIVSFIQPTRKWQEYVKPDRTDEREPDLLQGIEVIPMLRIFDKKKAEEFYIHWLGFKIEWEHRFEENMPVYMEIAKPGIKIHLTEHHGDCTPGGKAFIVCSGLREYHQQLLDKNYPFNRPGLEMASWGSLCMTAIDPFGNQLLFTEQKK